MTEILYKKVFFRLEFLKHPLVWVFFLLGITPTFSDKGNVPLLIFLGLLGMGTLYFYTKQQTIKEFSLSMLFLNQPSWVYLGYLFGVYIFVSCFWGIAPLKSLGSVLRLFLFIGISIFPFIYIEDLNRKSITQAQKSLLWGVGCLLLILILNIAYALIIKYKGLLGNWPLEHLLVVKKNLPWDIKNWPFRSWHTLTKPSFFLSFFFWPLSLYFLSKASEKKFWIWGIGVCFVCLCLPQRSAFLGMVFGLGSYAFIYKYPNKTSALVFFLLGIAMLSPFLGKYLFIPSQKNLLFIHMPQSWQHRFYIWNFVSNQIAQKPFLGWGFDASRYFPEVKTLLEFYSRSGSVIYTDPNGSVIPLHPHNGFLQIWLEGGSIGILLFLSMMYAGLTNLFKVFTSSKEKAIFMGGICTLFIPFCVSFGIWQTWWVGIFIWYLIFWAIYKKCNKIKEKKIIN